MSHILQQFIRASNPEELHDIEQGEHQGLYFHVFWKNRRHQYCGANNRLIHDFGLRDPKDIKNHNNLDFFTSEIASSLEVNDEKVLRDRKACIFFESGRLNHNGKFLHGITHKIPWFTRSNKLIGIMGLFLVAPESRVDPKNRASLSDRQIDCLYQLVRGHSTKGIAKQLGLSPRTVEHYLENIKIKLNAQTRQELVEKALSIDAIKLRLTLL